MNVTMNRGPSRCSLSVVKTAATSDKDTIVMRRLIKSSFLWQFAGGFALGAVGLFALQPAQAEPWAAPAPTHLSR